MFQSVTLNVPERPRTLQDDAPEKSPGNSQKAPERSQSAPERHQNAPERPPECSRTTPELIRTTPECSRTTPESPPNAPERHQNALERFPECSRMPPDRCSWRASFFFVPCCLPEGEPTSCHWLLRNWPLLGPRIGDQKQYAFWIHMKGLHS